MSDKVTIIVAAHKKYQMPADSMYLPVHVGAAGNESIGFQRDDEGENISELNPYFCELTGLYWAWKNLDSDYIGLAHYRRHFSMRPRSGDPWDSVLTRNEIAPYLGTTKVFVPSKRKYYIETLSSHYAHTINEDHLTETRKVIEDLYPDYLDAFDETIQRRWGYMFNMMIMEKSLLNDYSEWLFDILFALIKRLGTDGLTPFHARYCGRMGEIIFNVWLLQQLRTGRIKSDEIKEIPFIYMEKVNWCKKGGAFLKAKYLGKKYEESL